MAVLRFLLGDQLTRSVSALRDLDKKRDTVLMVEVADETTYVPHHPQKIVFILSAMRHFAEVLKKDGINVDYVKLDDPKNTGSFTGELQRALKRHKSDSVVMTEPGEWRVLQMMQDWRETLPVPLTIGEDDRFIASLDEFSAWAQGRKQLRMEYFYRDMRKKTGFLMEGDDPFGGAWNFDAENRKALPKNHTPPKRKRFAPDPITQDVIALVKKRFDSHYGAVEPFGWAVTRTDALKALDDFIKQGMESFGDYQDAMQAGAPFLYHSLISAYLNVGLLTAEEVCARVDRLARDEKIPLNAAEGFIRQIIGWREYVRGLYWLKMPDYAAANALGAKRALPAFFWTGKTTMNCLHQCIGDTLENAYAHHIQRLMVIGNFSLLAGLDPKEVQDWFLAVYADAFEWVELPNVSGMALFADGGVMASKPYAASGAYIDRMSDYCQGCTYSPKERTGSKACPFNYLYWDFLARNADQLSRNPRMGMPYKNLRAMDEKRRQEIARDAAAFLKTI
ncbi:cryptochrome/photolyase family protein [Rhizobiales bacterium TNE-4]|nr:cryptochrome/photolyase family protein [Rhizobiales bacterium TNE-4]MBV1827450.1 cryptochrome/photolyase family protein [Rhizobiales bacterium TNE-4]